jgi:quercetin dioxygenase-like cupin family protein
MTGAIVIQTVLSMAQQSGVKRTELQRHDLNVTGQEVVQSAIEFDVGASFGRHFHPGEEIIYVLEGVLEYTVDGRKPVSLKAGQVLFIPAGKIHAAKNIGSSKGTELATYIVRKGKRLVTMQE